MNNLIFKFKKFAFAAILIPLATIGLAAQISVSMVEKLAENSNQKCFDVFVENKSENKLGLAGQNLRFFYNSDQMFFIDQTLSSHLPKEYTELKLVQDFTDINGNGFGTLPFENTLGFVNLAVDFKEYSGLPLSLDKGTELSICSFCFEINEKFVKPEIVWARENLTSNYATAFVQVAIVDNNKVHRAANIVNYNVELFEGLSEDFDKVKDYSYFPNPFSSKLNVKFNAPTKGLVYVKVSDIFGNIVLEREVQDNTSEMVIDGENFTPGGYFIELRESDGRKSMLKAIKIK